MHVVDIGRSNCLLRTETTHSRALRKSPSSPHTLCATAHGFRETNTIAKTPLMCIDVLRQFAKIVLPTVFGQYAHVCFLSFVQRFCKVKLHGRLS